MLEPIGFLIAAPFAVAIFALVYIGVKEYKRIAAKQEERRGLDPALRDKSIGLSRFEMNQATRQLFKSDKTRSYMRRLAAKKRGGYQNRYTIEG